MPNNEGLFYKDFHTSKLDAQEVNRDDHKQPFSDEIGPQATSTIIGNNEPINRMLGVVNTNTAGRSISETITRDAVVWGGEFSSDLFGARDVKGTRHATPVIISRPYLDTGYDVHGLLDNIAIGYADIVSDYLRSHGLPTEHPIATYELKEIRLDGKHIPIEEWKQQALQEFINRDPDNSVEIQKVEKYLKEAKFYVLERELQTAERLRDLAICQNEEDFKRVITPVLKWVNAATEARQNGIIPGTEKPEKFDPESDDDIERYLSKWIPKQIGTYLGRLAGLGCVNQFPHAQNWSCAGTMYDLDSVGGREFGHQISKRDFQIDVEKTLGTLEELLNPTGGNYITEHFPGLIIEAKANFISAYLKEKGSVGKPRYAYFFDNSYYDGRNLHKRFITPEEWVKITRLMGYDTGDDELEEYKSYYEFYANS